MTILKEVLLITSRVIMLLCDGVLPEVIADAMCADKYEGDSICNEITPITLPTHGLELYTIYGMKDQVFTFQMVHETLFCHSYLSSYRI